jgi:hypothetical protein
MPFETKNRLPQPPNLDGGDTWHRGNYVGVEPVGYLPHLTVYRLAAASGSAAVDV